MAWVLFTSFDLKVKVLPSVGTQRAPVATQAPIGQFLCRKIFMQGGASLNLNLSILSSYR